MGTCDIKLTRLLKLEPEFNLIFRIESYLQACIWGRISLGNTDPWQETSKGTITPQLVGGCCFLLVWNTRHTNNGLIGKISIAKQAGCPHMCADIAVVVGLGRSTCIWIFHVHTHRGTQVYMKHDWQGWKSYMLLQLVQAANSKTLHHSTTTVFLHTVK